MSGMTLSEELAEMTLLEELTEMTVELIIKKRFCKGGAFRNEIEWLLENEDLPDEAVAKAFRDAIYGTEELEPLELTEHFGSLFAIPGTNSAIWLSNIVWRRMLYLLNEFDEEIDYSYLLEEGRLS